MLKDIESLKETLSFGGVRRLYEGRLDFDPHLNALQRFASGDLAVITATYMELADLYSTQGRYDFAGLLNYRSMEAFVEIGLREFAPAFKMDKPDWNLLPMEESQLRIEYGQLSPRYPFPDKVSLHSGFVILCVLDDLGQRFRRATNKNAVGMLMGLAHKRNRSYLAHEFENLDENDSRTLRSGAEDLAKAVLKDKYGEFQALRDQLRPIDLNKLWNDE